MAALGPCAGQAAPCLATNAWAGAGGTDQTPVRGSELDQGYFWGVYRLLQGTFALGCEESSCANPPQTAEPGRREDGLAWLHLQDLQY